MKTIIQSCIIFILVIMITITSIGLITHSALKGELTAAVSRGTEQTMNMVFIYRVYSADDSDALVSDVLQNIILSKSSDNPMVINIYNKDGMDDREIDVEAIETYKGLFGKTREVKYRVRMCVDSADTENSRGELYIKYAEPNESAELSESWQFSAASISNIKDFLSSDEGMTPSESRNEKFLSRYGYCKTNIS